MFEMLLPALGPVGQAIGGFIGGQQTNASNETIAKDTTRENMQEGQRNRDFQAEQVKAQQGYQTEMSNTAHQREVADLKAAGLNPILSANSGSSTPNGAAASGSQASAVGTTFQNPYRSLEGLSSNVLGALTAIKGLEKQDAETSLIKAQTGKTNIDAKVNQGDVPWSNIKNKIYDFLNQKVQTGAQQIKASDMQKRYNRNKQNLESKFPGATNLNIP